MATSKSTPAIDDTERQTFRIVPGPNPVEAAAIQRVFTRLHGIDPEFELDVRLVGREDDVAYYATTDAEHASTVEHTLRRLFPDETSIETAELPADVPGDDPAAAMELYGWSERRGDWQTGLPSVRTHDDSIDLPLASVVDTLADGDATVVYQMVCTPKPTWSVDAELRIDDLLHERDTYGQRLATFITGDYALDPSIEDVHRTHQERIEAIQDAATTRSFTVNVRAVADGPDAEAVLAELGTAFEPVEGDFYHVVTNTTTDDEATTAIAERLQDSECREQASLSTRLLQRVPVIPNNSPALVAGPDATANFCLLDGASLTNDGQRAMQATPGERTGVPHPEPDLLEQYDDGMLLGQLLDDDDTRLEEFISLPPTLQPLHLAWFGKTGSGKSTALINAILENQAVTDGADILLDSKGDGMPLEYLQAHYEKHGDLEDVYYFDCTRYLPAFSFFDIREQLDAGIDRTTAVEDVTDHYIEMLIGVMGRERFESAVRSPDIIRYLVKAMFDPVHGADAFTHRELQDAAARMHETRDAPPVVDPELQQMLGGVAANSKRSFDELMQGVANRIEKIPIDDRLGLQFNHVPDDEDDPRFEFTEVIDEDAVVIIDTGGLRPETQRVLTLVVLSQLWTALRHRTQQADTDGEDVPLVNLYLEEAAAVANAGVLTDLLAQSRSFGLSMTLAMQFPGQLRQADHEAYAEVLNNVSTIVTGNVGVDDDLAKRLATADMPPSDVANRLRALRRGEWLASLPSQFGTAEPRPFHLESAPLPAGHPESDDPITGAERTAFQAAYDTLRDRCRIKHGLEIAARYREAVSDRHRNHSTDEHADDTTADPVDADARLDSALPYTERMPDPVEYDAAAHALVCTACDARFDPTSDGLRYAIECCHRLDKTDREAIPICELNLKLTTDERRQSAYSDAQLRVLQAVFMAHQREFDPDIEYDLLRDSMVRLQEYVGVSHDAVQELVDAGLLAVDCTYPYKLYTVTADGRSEAKIEYKEGMAYGDGHGDLGESSLHVLMVELLRRYLAQSVVDDPDSPAERTDAYHEVDGSRLDAVALDADGDIVAAAEAERSNHDTRQAVPDDYDKMAATNPDHAVWLVKNRDACHDVLKALNDPPDDNPRVDKVYSRNTAPQQFTLDYDGLTELHTLQYLRDQVLEDP